MTWLTAMYVIQGLSWVLLVGLAVSVVRVQRSVDAIRLRIEGRSSEGARSWFVSAPTCLWCESPKRTDHFSVRRATDYSLVHGRCLPALSTSSRQCGIHRRTLRGSCNQCDELCWDV